MPRTEIDKKVDFVMRLARALHSYGAAAYGLEDALSNVSSVLNLEAEFSVTPTVIIASFQSGDEQKQSIIRVRPGGVDLEKMTLLDKLGDSIIEEKINLNEAFLELQSIISRKNPYNTFTEFLAYIVLAASFAILFAGGLHELLASLIVGSLVALYAIFAPKRKAIVRFFEFIVSFIASFGAGILYLYYPYFSIELVTLASLLVFIPGLGLTISMTELATDNLSAGTARLMGTVIVFLKMIFGVILGSTLFSIWTDYSISVPEITNPFPEEFRFFALVPAAICFAILFRASLKDSIWMLIAGIIASLSSTFISLETSSAIGTLSGGFLVGLSSNLYARAFQKPAAVILIPAIILLVPGSFGFRALKLLAEKNTIAGIETAFEMFIIAIALVAGLLLANILLASKRSL